MVKRCATLEAAERKAREWARLLRRDLPRGWGFVVFLASLGKGGATTYLSTIERDDSIRMIKEWLARVSPGGSADAPGFVDRTETECWCCETRENLVLLNGPLRSIALCRRCWNSTEERQQPPAGGEERGKEEHGG